MLNIIISKFFTAFVQFLTNQSKDNFQQVVAWVIEAESKFQNGQERAKWVREQMQKVLNISVSFILNVLLEIAVAYATKKGYINEGKQ